MFRIIILLIVCLFYLLKVSFVEATNSFVTIVNPIRGNDFWETEGQKPADAIFAQMNILKSQNVPVSWLLRYDALSDQNILGLLRSKPASHDLGIFLEITPTWTKEADVNYRQSPSWHFAESVFLTGYEQSDRVKLIDKAFEKFNETFKFYPKSVGAWWIDSYSLDYMQVRYGVKAALIVADQYTTDNYQIWGQYFQAPFYPSKRNTLIPAQTKDNKIPVVVMQWASRDPVNGYGNGVQESTYSVQANDYIGYHELNTDYFSKLVDIFTRQDLNQFNQVVVGLENSFSWKIYGGEYEKQIRSLVDKRRTGQIDFLNMSDFAIWYELKFPDISPEHIIVAEDPLGSGQRSVWFMNPFYRAGWFFNKTGSVFRDIRPYIEGSWEPCFEKTCQELNFATSAVRVLDDVTFGTSWILDEGKITDFKVERKEQDFSINYINEVGRRRVIRFMPRDLSIDGHVKTIDATILEITDKKQGEPLTIKEDQNLKTSFPTLFLNFVKFLGFVMVAFFLPGYLLVGFKDENLPIKIFLAICIGFCTNTLVAYLSGYLLSKYIYFVVVLYIGISILALITTKKLRDFSDLMVLPRSIKANLAAIFIIVSGTIFQTVELIKSGWVYSFGVGFFGPLARDGVWHQALVNQLVKQVPPINPGTSGEILSNYHYFYDLLVALTHKLTGIPVMDLIFRFYPILFSLLLGLGSYLFANRLFKNKFAALIGLYFVYFGSSFGWIVEFLRERHFGGESAFWASQSVSMNLNPPFAISILTFLAGLYLFHKITIQKSQVRPLLLPLVILWGSLIGFKAYGGTVVLGALFLVSWQWLIFKKDLSYFKIFIPILIISLLVFLPQNKMSGALLVFAPFWFIHSMVDLNDRVGWQRLSLARQAYLERGQWLKFTLAEVLGLVIFIIGNLGVKFVSLLTLITFIKVKLWNKPIYSFIFFVSFLSLIIPILFIQKGNPWNTIQFMYYFLFLMSFFAGFVLLTMIKRLAMSLKIITIATVILINPISSFFTFKSSFEGKPPASLPPGELTALNYLNGLEDGNVLSVPFNKNLRAKYTNPYPLVVYDATTYISAFSSKASFFEDEIQQEILHIDSDNSFKRQLEAKDFFYSGDLNHQKKFLTENNIRYIYLPKIHKVSLNTEKLGLEKVFENEEAVIFLR